MPSSIVLGVGGGVAGRDSLGGGMGILGLEFLYNCSACLLVTFIFFIIAAIAV
jgi:hypothetical protein